MSKLRLCLISGINSYNIGPAFEIRNLLEDIADSVVLVTHKQEERIYGEVRDEDVLLPPYPFKAPLIIKIMNHLLIQLMISFNLIVKRKQFDYVVLHRGGQRQLLPIMVSCLIRKKVILFILGAPEKEIEMWYGKWCWGIGGKIIVLASKVMSYLSCYFADRLAVLSPSMSKEISDSKKRKNVYVCNARWINTDLFFNNGSINSRPNAIGYVGRLSHEKGITNLLQALPLLPGLHLLIIGDGPLYNEIQLLSKSNGTFDRLTMVGWIPHLELPHFFGKMRLLVLPSFTEGLPTVVLEAMACGTPPLATPLGGVTDVVRDGETGFILDGNSPQIIASKVEAALNHPNIESIANNARNLIITEYSYGATIERYRKLFFGWSNLDKS